MNDHTPDTVGLDISKAHLDVHRRTSGDSARFANDAAGFEALTAWLGDTAAWVVTLPLAQGASLGSLQGQEVLVGRLVRQRCMRAFVVVEELLAREAGSDGLDGQRTVVESPENPDQRTKSTGLTA